ncbi:hypothetical protein TCON_2485 [Astathelohania contejeani]|uniref:Man1/Src1-like C-terminal domain-containing protein n=1 Tax=Astathelohania contejeani TaxID=164912 RepID=A0ABQ7HVV3_9MICR|nr:hypothetical protein TCON_2485 [Thelohania contejeani]
MAKEVTPDQYLDPDFDYSKLTKEQLRKIIYLEGGKPPAITMRKEFFLDEYRKVVVDRIDKLRKKYNVVADGSDIEFIGQQTNFSDENPFQVSEGGTPRKRTPRKSVGVRINSHVKSSTPLKNSDSPKTPLSSGLEVGTPKPKSLVITPQKTNKIVENIRHKPYIKHFKAQKETKFYFLSILFVIISIFVYFKHFCPYESKLYQSLFPYPENCGLIDGRLQCKEGYVLKERWILPNKCVLDIHPSLKEALNFIREANTRYQCKMRNTNKVPINQIHAIIKGNRELLINQLLAQEDIKLDGKMVYSTRTRWSQKVIIEYVLRLAIKFVFIPGFALIFIYACIMFFISRRKRRAEMDQKAVVVVRDILEALRNQVRLSESKYIPTMQLRDYFGIEKEVWDRVEKLIKQNSNVRISLRTINGDQKMTWEWIGPMINLSVE